MSEVRTWGLLRRRNLVVVGVLLGCAVLAWVTLSHTADERPALSPADSSKAAPPTATPPSSERPATPFVPVRTGKIKNAPLRPGIEKGLTPEEREHLARLRQLRRENLQRQMDTSREEMIRRGMKPEDADRVARTLRVIREVSNATEEGYEHPVWTREGLLERGFTPEEAERLLEARKRIKRTKGWDLK